MCSRCEFRANLRQAEEGDHHLFEERGEAGRGENVIGQGLVFAIAVPGMQGPEEPIGIGGCPEIHRHPTVVQAQCEMRWIGV